jgi:translocation and assembly module TamB
MRPLSLDGLAAGFGRDLPVSGDVSGTLRVIGPFSDLNVSASLETVGGPIAADVRLDARDPFRRYVVDGRVAGFELAQLLEGVPEETVLTGVFQLDGSGASLDELDGTGSVAFQASTLGPIDLDAVEIQLRAEGGRLIVEELAAESPLGSLTGSGELGLREGETGQLSVVWAVDSLSALRPVVFGDETIVADTLTDLEREILRLDGIDPDTLAATGSVPLTGRAHGEAIIRGTVQDFEAEGFAELYELAYDETSVAAARADFTAAWRGSDEWGAQGTVELDSARVGGFELAEADGIASYGANGGTFDMAFLGAAQEVYTAAGAFARDSLGIDLELVSFTMEAPETTWRLEGASELRVEGSMVRTDGFRLIGDAEAEITARGAVDLEGESSFALSVQGVDVRELGRVLQAEDLPSGLLDLEARVRGPSEAPEIEGEFEVRNLLIGDRSLSSLGGTIEYMDEELEAQITGAQEGREIVRVEGRFPVDLSFREVEERFLDREMDITVAVDSLPASTALATLTLLEEVDGVLNGEVRFVGVRGELRPTGEIQLSGGAFSIPDVGLDLSGIGARFQVSEDFAVEVQAEGRAGGLARVSGSLLMDDPLDPVFDLQINASGFQAIDRSDLTAQVGGDLTLTGRYTAPLIGGSLTIESGELFLDEFVRGAEVIDLNDPRFMDVVDTTLVAEQAVVAPTENPFMQNLRVGVSLSLERDFWIRSRESAQGMDVEIAGSLQAGFDRPRREIVLNGTLEAVRGTYNQFGRQFAIQSGTLEFPGTPGIDPSLSIAAVYRLRREGAAPLEIVASVEGTLQDPQVSLSSESQPPIPESDLISYLLFGRPSFALASGADQALVNEALTGVVSYGVSQLGTQVSRSLGVDYLSISQAETLDATSIGGGLFRDQFENTQIEMGRYLGEDLFASIAIRPLGGRRTDVRQGTRLPSLRLEWTFAEFWSLEGFLEDRLQRQGSAAFTELDQPRRTWGLSIFREWGY